MGKHGWPVGTGIPAGAFKEVPNDSHWRLLIMGMIYRPKYRRRDGTLVESAVWWLKFYRDGAPIRESSGTDKETKARQVLKLREGAVVRGEPIIPRASRVTIDELLEGVARNYRIRELHTTDAVERRIKLHLKPFFGGRRAANISTADVEKFIEQRQGEKASNAEINRELAIVKRAFSLGMKCTPPTVLFKPHVPMLTEDNTRKGFFDAAQFETVFSHLPAPVQAVVRFAFETGWRINSEVLPLTWRQVDFAAETVRLDPGTTKNKKGRVVKFTGELRELLTRQRALTEQDQRKFNTIVPEVFHRGGRPIHYFRRAWITACKKAGCPGRIPHDLRRSAVRNFVRAGVSQTIAMQMSGHKTDAVFRRYDIVSEADLADAARRLDDAAGKVSGKVPAFR